MKKIIVFVLLSLSIFQETSVLKGQELIDIAHFIQENDMLVDEWSVTIKEKNNSKTVLSDTVQQLSEQYQQTTSETEDANIYIYEGTHYDDLIDVTFKVVVPKTQAPGEVVATISGYGWDHRLLENYLHTLRNIDKTYFTKKTHVYTCLSVEEDAIIKSDNFVEKVENSFNLSHIKTQTDKVQKNKHKKMLYGYTPIWEEKLTIKDEPMNLQLVIDGDNSAKQKIFIGTPILINEY